jgi:hypothetical protein
MTNISPQHIILRSNVTYFEAPHMADDVNDYLFVVSVYSTSALNLTIVILTISTP